MCSANCIFSSLVLLTTVAAVDPGSPQHGRMQATVLAEGDMQMMMRKENVSETDREEKKSCKCTDVDLKGKKFSPGALKKCIGCKKVSKATASNDCPKDWKIFSPRSKEDWATLISLKVLEDVAKPHLLIDVTQSNNGCGGCVKKAMNSEEEGQSMWKTLDGTDWFLRSTPYGEPNGDYTADCFLGVLLPVTDAGDIRFNDWNCAYHSTAYLCQPDDRYTTTTTKAEEKSSARGAPGLVLLLGWLLVLLL